MQGSTLSGGGGGGIRDGVLFPYRGSVQGLGLLPQKMLALQVLN